MSKQHMVIRGARILQQISETTVPELETNVRTAFPDTEKRHNALNDVQVGNIEVTPYTSNKELKITAQAQTVTNDSSGGPYPVVIMFRDIQYEAGDTPDNVTFTATDGEEYSMSKIPLDEKNCRVRCACMDFRFRFSVYNRRNDALHGQPFPPYVPQGKRPPVNPTEVPGVCKHIMKTVVILRDSGVFKQEATQGGLSSDTGLDTEVT